MRKVITIILLIISCNIIFSHCRFVGKNKEPDQLSDGIATGSLSDVELDEDVIASMTDSINRQIYPNIHSVLIVYNDKLVYEKYWPGKDENRKTGYKGFTEHQRDSLHDIRSITKSIVSAAMMLAIEQQKVKSVDQRLFDFFPEYAKYDTGMKKTITIKHLLTMTAGLRWSDDYSFDDSLKINSIPYAIEFILRQKLVDTPGSKFRYSAGCTQLLAAIIEKATGENIEVFTSKYLFEPLGINSYLWTKENNGLFSAWAGLRMRSRDMVKFGLLYLNQGKWNGKQIIPAGLVDESFKTHVYTDPPYGYGYQFWALIDTIENKAVKTAEASGNGGQKIEINRAENLIVVITAGNYDLKDLTKGSFDLYLDFILSAIRKKK